MKKNEINYGSCSLEDMNKQHNYYLYIPFVIRMPDLSFNLIF